MAGPMARTVPEVTSTVTHPTLSSWSVSLWPGRTAHHRAGRMFQQTHHPSGRHRHNAVFDWRQLRAAQQRPESTVKPVVHTRQLDYLYSQLEQLKTNMREKQSSLANVSTEWGGLVMRYRLSRCLPTQWRELKNNLPLTSVFHQPLIYLKPRQRPDFCKELQFLQSVAS